MLLLLLVHSCLPLSTCVGLMDILFCDQQPTSIPVYIDGLYDTLKALFPAVVTVTSPAPVKQSAASASPMR